MDKFSKVLTPSLSTQAIGPVLTVPVSVEIITALVLRHFPRAYIFGVERIYKKQYRMFILFDKVTLSCGSKTLFGWTEDRQSAITTF